jgi:Asp-tRNA(Asn)/Glu-tRNA(Gln) amidotransferase A subunit family amidase
MDEQAFLPENDFARFDAIELAELVRRKEVSATELVEAAIARIERLNPSINAVVAKMYEDARAIARGHLPDAPFAGVPFLLKDSLASYRPRRPRACCKDVSAITIACWSRGSSGRD